MNNLTQSILERKREPFKIWFDREMPKTRKLVQKIRDAQRLTNLSALKEEK